MKTVLVGSVESTRAAFSTMIASSLAPSLLVTLPRGCVADRHSDYVDLTGAAQSAGVEIHYTQHTDNPETLETISRHEPDMVLVIGWSQLVSEEFRRLPRLGCLGYHPSALPKLRGRSVIPWTILLDESESGATFFWLADGADTGDIAVQERFPINSATETARSLYDKHLDAISELLPKLLRKIVEGDVARIRQDHAQATICAKRTLEDCRIDWNRKGVDVERLIRAVGPPYPGAYSDSARGRIVITAADLAKDSHRYIGLPGQVQAHSNRGFVVMCGDGICIEIAKWSGLDRRPPLHSKLID